MKRITLSLICWLFLFQEGSAQCTISGKTRVCLGDMALYELTGSAVSSVKWKMGDGASSADLKARHMYKKTGSYTVSCEANLKAGGTCTASIQVEVVGLPVPAFDRFGSRDSCQFVNNICFKDKSTPASPGQPIVKRLVVWGDGAFDKSDDPGNNADVCHSYASADHFKLKFEVTDIYGCKNSTQAKVKIVTGPRAVISHEISEPKCGWQRVCFNNVSDIPDRSSNTYSWNIDGYAFSRTDKTQECHDRNTTHTYVVHLVVSTAGGCRSETRDTVVVDPKPLSTRLEGNSKLCYGTYAPQFWVSGGTGARIEWSVNGKLVNGFRGDTLRFSPKGMDLAPGKYRVAAFVSRGACSEQHSMDFTVEGPVAHFRMAGRLQCSMTNKVFMWDVTELQDKRRASWYWNIDDVEGENCVSWRRQGQNLYKNCNESKDWYHKHVFDSTRGAVRSLVTMAVYDSVTGCADTAFKLIKNCCGNFSRKGVSFKICQGDSFLRHSDNSDPELEPVAFSLDTGRTFYPYPSQVFAPHQGLYGVYLVWRKARPDSAADFGNDSLITFVDTTKGFDTLFYPGLLTVIPVHDTVYNLAYSGLNPKRVKIMPADPVFKEGDRIVISWGDGRYSDTTLTSAGRIDSFVHLYGEGKFRDIIHVTVLNREGCSSLGRIRIGWGLEPVIDLPELACGSRFVCFTPKVLDYSTDRYWSPYDGKARSFKWFFGDSSGMSTDYSPCHTYAKPGIYKVKLVVSDSIGHRDSAYTQVIIQQLVAGVTSESKDFYCSEIKQLFDSSYLKVYDPEDDITDYLWDFGSKAFTTIEKDPYHTFENGGTYHVVHVVKSRKGCTDTVDFEVKISGSEAAFDVVGDTVGCAPFLVTFRNLSKNCSHYIWEYGDHENTVHNTDKTGNDTFRYYKAGRFSVGLYGIDTFYNPNTGNVYYCNSYYPGKESPVIITVLPSPKTGLLGPDTLCVGSLGAFQSLSEKEYEMDEWLFQPGSNRYSMLPAGKRSVRFNTAGEYYVRLRPWYTILPGQPRCFDSAVKKVTVLEVNADFNINPKSEDPIYTFNNLSRPADASFTWDFGQPKSPTNISNETHPTHDFYPDRDTFRVCLFASIPAGCRDTFCRTVRVNYFEELRLANVFTPDENDALNKEWDIIIDGEKLYKLRIFNRWGEVVFESDRDVETGEFGNWNGRVMNTGPECPEGTYFYQFTYAFVRGDQQAKTVTGSINLIR